MVLEQREVSLLIYAKPKHPSFIRFVKTSSSPNSNNNKYKHNNSAVGYYLHWKRFSTTVRVQSAQVIAYSEIGHQHR